MPHPYPMASVFTEGMRRDADRTMLPGGSVWNLVDFIPDEIQAAASGRGGWTYAGPSLSGATKIQFLGIYYPDSSSTKLLAVDQTNAVWDAISGGAITGTVNSPAGPPVYHRGKLIFPSDGSAAVTAYNGTSVGSLAGSPPPGRLAGVYKDHALLADSAANTNRLWFSAAGDPTTWDTSFGWWDTTGIINGIATTQNSILIFHPDSTERLRGTTPPPGTDMVLEPFFTEGTVDRMSIAYWQQNVIFASSRGIYITDGASITDLTAAAQMKTYWRSILSGVDSTWRIAAGIYRDHYIVSVNNSTSPIDVLCLSLNNKTMWRLTNLTGSSFANLTGTTLEEKLYMGQWNHGRIIELSSLWSPSASVKQDGDGTNPTPIIETGSFRGWDRLHRRWIQSMGLQKWGYTYCDYDLRDAATDNPTITMSYALSPGGSYTAMTGGTLPATTDYTRKRRSIGNVIGGAKRSNMMEMKIAVTGPYATCNLYSLEATYEPIDIGRLK